MSQLLTQLLELLFPSNEEVRKLHKISKQDFIKHYELQRVFGAYVLANYQQPEVRLAITQNKFHNDKIAAQLLSTLITRWLNENTGEIIFIPIPLSNKRKRERGYNQLMPILENLDVAVETNWLMRTKDTTPQTKLPKTERIKNMDDVFSCTKEMIDVAEGVTVVLFDDVLTTGTTMKAARASLTPHLPPHTRLICLALAH